MKDAKIKDNTALQDVLNVLNVLRKNNMSKELIIKESQPIIIEALSLKIKSHGDMLVATELVSELNRYNDKITAEKEKITKPLLEALKVERTRWKTIESSYESAIQNVRAEMTRYQTEQTRLQKEKEQKIADKLSSGKIDIDKAVQAIEKINIVDKNVSTQNGSVQFREVKKFEVMDIIMLSEVGKGEYILANETAIREALKVGTELPGVRYYTEQVPYNTR